jgi:hypothetical protein
MNTSNDRLNRLKDLVTPGRRKIRLLEEALAQEQERFNQLERTLSQSLTYQQESGLLQKELKDELHSVRTEFHDHLGSLHGQLGSLQGQFEEKARQLVELQYEIKFERNRIDYVLAAQEGILDEMEAFHRARTTPDYQAVFTKNNPLVSIVVATANRPDLLIDRCLASILRQTYQNFEVIVVGDHCVDSTPERVAALNDARITFHNLPKRGPYPLPDRDRWCVAGSYPTNAAFPLCKGEFVTHLDDDDEFYPDRTEIMVQTIQQTKADILYHPYWYEEENGCWRILGNGNFECGQIGTDTIFYHRYLTRIPEDVFAYRMGEPNDWNRLRKIAMLRPQKHFVNRPLVRHYFGRNPPPFVAQEGETFSY